MKPTNPLFLIPALSLVFSACTVGRTAYAGASMTPAANPMPPLGAALPALASTGEVVDIAFVRTIRGTGSEDALCLLRRDGTVSCGGRPFLPAGMQAVSLQTSFLPSVFFTPTWSGGDAHVCALLADGRAVCGLSAYEVPKPPPLLTLAARAGANASLFFTFGYGSQVVACVSQSDGATTCEELQPYEGVTKPFPPPTEDLRQGRRCTADAARQTKRCEATPVVATDWAWMRSLAGTVASRFQGPYTNDRSVEATCGIDREHRVWCQGDGSAGQLGAGDLLQAGKPVKLAVPWLAQSLASNQGTFCALTAQGEVYCWGDAHDGAAPVQNAVKLVACDEDSAETKRLRKEWHRHEEEQYESCMRMSGSNGPLGCNHHSEPPIRAFKRTPKCVLDLPQDGDARVVRTPTRVDLGAPVVTLKSAPATHAFCALLTTGKVRCWGAPVPAF